jgi:hypothetical protein
MSMQPSYRVSVLLCTFLFILHGAQHCLNPVPKTLLHIRKLCHRIPLTLLIFSFKQDRMSKPYRLVLHLILLLMSSSLTPQMMGLLSGGLAMLQFMENLLLSLQG